MRALRTILGGMLGGVLAVLLLGATVSSPPAGYEPTDVTVSQGIDNFVGGSTTDGALGDLGWNATTIGGAPTFGTNGALDLDNPGSIFLTTSATSGQGGTLGLHVNTGGTGVMFVENSSRPWSFTFRVRPFDTANVRERVGIAGTANGVEPTNGVWFRFDTNVAYADTTWKAVCRSAGSNASTVDTTVTPTASTYQTFKMRAPGDGNIYWKVGSAAEVSAAYCLANGLSMSPMVILATDTTATKSFILGYFGFKLTSLAR